MDEIRQTARFPRELEWRENDGVEVALLWSESDNRVSVSVVDSRSGHSFELAVEDESPLDVFYHPYAYAAFRGVEYEEAGREQGEPICA